MARAEAEVTFVSIVEDVPEVRDGLALLIDGADDFSALGLYGSVEALLDDVGSNRPDIVLMDIGLPGMSGVDGVRLLRAKHPGLKVVMLTVYDNNERVFEAICAGADGYLLKTTPPAQLLEALRDIVAGGAPMSPTVSRRVLEMFQRSHGKTSGEFDLSQREAEILHHLVEGNSYKMIAGKLSISAHTVNFHLKNIYRKLHVNSKSEAVAAALRNRIV